MIEVILQEIVFSDSGRLTLSLAVEEEGKRNILKWVVSSDGRSTSPIVFFRESELAREEFKRRCGEEMLRGRLVESNEVFGSLRGYFIYDKAAAKPIRIRKDGYKVVKKSAKETVAWRKKVLGRHPKETLKLTDT
jgi:hypothetical protein